MTLTGTHPFSKSFQAHLVPALAIYLERESLSGLEKYFRRRFAGIIAGENSASQEETDRAVKRSEPSNKSILLRRSRYWIDSAVLGSRLALKEQAIVIWGSERGKKKRFGRAFVDDDLEIYGLRQLS
ncbi:MAG: hypothetical protein NE334_03100 [Lentisphaeraceae bacterium]|nr:hypothetical protein [Lentisphaeraceae bacterium]